MTGGASASHQAVLYQEVMAGLQPAPGGRYIDGTVGAGGHAAGLLALSAPDGTLLGLDRDPDALRVAGERLAEFGSRVRLLQASYTQMAEAAGGFAPVDGILLDLGLSSLQLADAKRGFAFQLDGPLDMRFDPAADLTAADIVNGWPQDDLEDIIYRYGEDPHGRRIARAIVAARPLTTTAQLAEVVARAAGGRGGGAGRTGRARVHPATRTFQALRIAVNDELGRLEAVLPVALSLLRPGGRLAVISFHSLEDRLVKNYIRGQARPPNDPSQPYPPPFTPSLAEVTRKPIWAGEAEAAGNPRSRSARLRVAEKL